MKTKKCHRNTRNQCLKIYKKPQKSHKTKNKVINIRPGISPKHQPLSPTRPPGPAHAVVAASSTSDLAS